MSFFLDEEYRAKARYYLGYPNLESRFTLQSGIPLAVPTQEILEVNMRNILDQFSLNMVIDLIDQIEESRCEIRKAKRRLKASEIAYTFKSNQYEISQLWSEDYKLVEQLSIALACPIYFHPTGKSISKSGNYNIDVYNRF